MQFQITLAVLLACLHATSTYVSQNAELANRDDSIGVTDLVESSEENPILRGPLTDLRRRFCTCQESQCGCCVQLKVERFNFSQQGCLNFTFQPEEVALLMNVYLNDRSLVERNISGQSLPPICVPVPQVPFIKVCIRVHDVYYMDSHMYACVSMQLVVIKRALWSIEFGCIRVGASGISVVPGPKTDESTSSSEDGL